MERNINRLIDYCLQEGYLTMEQFTSLKEKLASHGKEKEIYKQILQELGWEKKKLIEVMRKVSQNSETQNIEIGSTFLEIPNRSIDSDTAVSEIALKKLTSDKNRGSDTPPIEEPEGKRFGKYILVKKLGSGGMGKVFKAYHTNLHCYFALKMVLPGKAGEEDIKRFEREARVAFNLKHPNIAQVHDVGEQDAKHYIAMDYIEGKTLKEMIEERRFWPRSALEIILQIAQALQYSHEKGIIHRDIKPSNIMITEKEGKQNAYLMDFGLATAWREEGITRSGQIMGTPQYMSPEQAMGIKKLDGKSDLYSLGAVLYEMLSGKPLVESNHVMAVLYEVLHKDHPLLSKSVYGISKDVEAITMKCLEKDTARRYQNAGELAEEVERYLRGEAVLARSPGPIDRLWYKAKRNWRLVTFVATFILILAVGMGLWINALSRKTREIEIASLEKQAKESEKVGDLKGASGIYLSIFKIDKDNKEANEAFYRIINQILKTAQTHQKNEDLRKAKEIYEEVLKLDPENKNAEQGISQIKMEIEYRFTETKKLEENKLFDDALGICKKLINWAPEDMRFAKYVLELTQNKDKCRKEARQYYDRAMEIFWNPMLEEDDIKYCQDLFQKACEIDHKFADAYYQLGRASHRLYNTGKAIDYYRESIKIDPNLTPAKYYYTSMAFSVEMGDVWLGKGNLGKLDKIFRDIWFSGSDNHQKLETNLESKDAYYLLAQALLIFLKTMKSNPNDKEAWEPVLKCCDRVINISPNFSDVYLIRAQLYSYPIDFAHRVILIDNKPLELDKALKDCTKSIYLDPFRTESYALRGEIYKLIGAYEIAEKDFTTALLLKRGLKANLYRNRAVCYMAMNKWELAMDDVEENTKLTKEAILQKSDALLYKTFLKALLQDKQEAEKAMTRYFETREPNLSRYDEFIKGLVYIFIDKENNRAEEAMKTFLKANSDIFRPIQAFILFSSNKNNISSDCMAQKVALSLKDYQNIFCLSPELKVFTSSMTDFLSKIKVLLNNLIGKDFEFAPIARSCLENLNKIEKGDEKYKAIDRIFKNEYPPLTVDIFIHFINYMCDDIKMKDIIGLKELPLASLYYRRASEFYIKENKKEKNKDDNDYIRNIKQDLEAALELDPNYMEAHYGLATIYSILSEKNTSYRDLALYHLKQAVEMGWSHIEDYTLKDSDFKSLGLGEKSKLEEFKLWNKRREENQKQIQEFKGRIEEFIKIGKPILALKLLYEPQPVFFQQLKKLLESTEERVMKSFEKEWKEKSDKEKEDLDRRIELIFGEKGKLIWEWAKNKK